MIEVSYDIFKNAQNASTVLRNLEKTKFPDFKSSYKVKRMVDAINSEFKVFMKFRKEIQDEAIYEKDDDGNHKTDPMGRPLITNEADLEKKIDDLLKQKFEMKWGPLIKEELEMVKPSAADLHILEQLTDPAVFDEVSS